MKVQRQPWNDQAARVLAPALADDSTLIRQMVNRGEAECWAFDGGRIYLISRIEGRELVAMCLAGQGLHQAAPLIIAAAKRAGCESIRLHTPRPAMGRMVARYGFTERERVFAMRV